MIQNKPDGLNDQLRLVVLDVMTAACSHDVQAIPRAAKPFFRHRSPRVVTLGGLVHELRRRIGLHTREHGDGNIRQRFQSFDSAGILNAHRLTSLISFRALETAQLFFEEGTKLGGIWLCSERIQSAVAASLRRRTP